MTSKRVASPEAGQDEGSVGNGLALAYPSRRYHRAWLGIIVRSLQSVIIIGASLAVVMR